MIFNSIDYYFNPFSIPPVIVAGLTFIFCFFFANIDRNSPFNRLLILYCSVMALGLTAYSIALNTVHVEVARVWFCLQFSANIWLSALAAHLVSVATNIFPRNKGIVFSLYAVAIFLTAGTWHPSAFETILPFPWGLHPVGGVLPPALNFYLFLCFAVIGVFDL